MVPGVMDTASGLGVWGEGLPMLAMLRSPGDRVEARATASTVEVKVDLDGGAGLCGGGSVVLSPISGSGNRDGGGCAMLASGGCLGGRVLGGSPGLVTLLTECVLRRAAMLAGGVIAALCSGEWG